jgi:methionyl aminopeptidase
MNVLTNLLQVNPSPAKQDKLPKGINIKTEREIAIMRESGKIVATVLKEVAAIVQPGMTTADIDAYAEKRIREMGAKPSFKGLYGFPATICSSINNEIVHGIPSKKKTIRNGDVLKVDTGAFYEGFHGDSCITIAVGEVSTEAARLIRAAEEALYAGIAKVKAGAFLLDLALPDTASDESYTRNPRCLIFALANYPTSNYARG